jgi:hypothetical protein
MSCNNLENILSACALNSGGIYEFYYVDQSAITDVTIDPLTYVVTSITSSTAFNKIEFARNTGNFVENGTNDPINGSNVVEQIITLMLNRRQALTSRALKIAGEGNRYLSIIVKDANGLFWYFDYVTLTATGEGSGTLKADGSKYSVTFTAQANALAPEVDDSIIPALFTIS